MDNRKLLTEIRSGDMEDRSWMIDILDRAADALEAAEAELGRQENYAYRGEAKTLIRGDKRG